MKTTYRDENNKLQKSVIEENYKYHYIHEWFWMNNKKFEIIDIVVDDINKSRLIKMKEINDERMTYLEYKMKRGDYDIVKKPK
jgi:hypothetical protein